MKGASCSPLASLTNMFSSIICFGTILMDLKLQNFKIRNLLPLDVLICPYNALFQSNSGRLSREGGQDSNPGEYHM